MKSIQTNHNRFRKRLAFTASFCLLTTSLNTGVSVQAAQTKWLFDFGGNGAASGYTAVSAADGYTAAKGYGFANPGQVKNVNAAGSGALSDAVQFTDTSQANTFNADLPNGLYEMKVTLGNTTRATVWAENMLQIVNMTGNNATDTIQIPVTDGQLNLTVTAGKDNTSFSISALELTKLSDDPTMKPTIWVCGDSTVCNYYPLDSSTQAGWAQMLGNYVDTSKFNIRNLAASGQYAKGFVDAGQFTPIEQYGKVGDYYIISMGINDTNYSNAEEYEQVITDMVQRAKKKGMTVILVKQQGRADDISRTKLLNERWFGGVLDKIGTAENVQVVDLFTSSQNYWLSIGQEAVYKLFMDGDTLHPNRAGADKLAELVAKEIAFASEDTTVSSSDMGYAEKFISQTPTVYMVGDSTMCNYNASAYPQTGWGQLISNYFNGNVKVDNRARAGRSSKMFIEEGTWNTVKDLLQQGDYVFLSFGINDGNYNNADRYAPVSDGTFQKYMKIYIEDTLEKGATPVLFTTVLGLSSYQKGTFVSSYQEYCDAIKQLAAEYQLPCIDLNSLMVAKYNEVGYDTAFTYHMISATENGTDKTHFTEAGATIVAELASEALTKTNLYLGTMVSATNEDAVVPDNFVKGDVNNDGKFNVSDVVALQKWLLAVPDTHLANWKAADLCEDNKLNACDLCLMKRLLLNAEEPFTQPVTSENSKQVEALNRGLIAANTGKGMFVSWRNLATDTIGTSFKLYKNGALLKEFGADAATNYLDASGSAADKYTIETYSGSTKQGGTESAIVLGTKNGGQSGAYFDIPLDIPAPMTMPDGSTCTYSPNDASVGDADGDGEYEIILKWDPSNSKDNSQEGYTGNVYIDCYKLNGSKLWRVDLGKNIRAGAHYTQFMVFDYDGDGIAEMVCKTADGTVDGAGNVIGNAGADYRSDKGRILSGPEYLTLFDCKTGKALDTVDYKPGRGTVSNWGDNYGNRVDRFVAATAYLDGQTPSVIMGRGYYTRMALTAYDVQNKKLIERWAFDTGHNASVPGYGDGNHNCMPADVDGDGKQEIVMGSAVIDDNGTLLYTSGMKHGDAMHVGDFDPSNPGVEIFMCHEEESAGFGISLRDGKTGTMLFREKGTSDTGRCLAGNFVAGNSSAELVGAQSSNVYDTAGNVVCQFSDITKWGQNSVIYWTDTLERCVMDRTMIDQYGKGRVFTGDGVTSNNSSKSNACLSCDLFGDWREEVIFPTGDGTALRVFSTTYATDYKIYTLMQNPQYRAQVAGQNVAYNQPPHTDFFLGTGFALPELPDVYAVKK